MLILYRRMRLNIQILPFSFNSILDLRKRLLKSRDMDSRVRATAAVG